MKNIIVIILVLVGLTTSAQDQPQPYTTPTTFKPMNGNYSWRGELIFRDTMWLDSAVYSPSGAGLVMVADTAGVDSTGFIRMGLGAISGYVTGSGAANRVPYWTSSSNISSNSGFTWNPTTSRLTTSGGTFPAMKIANYSIADTNSSLRFKRGAVEKFGLTANGTVFHQNSYYEDSLFIRTTLLNPATGFFLGYDTAGTSVSGFSKVIPKAAVTGTSVINNMAYWTGGGAISGSASLTFNPTTTALSLAAGTGTTPLSVTGTTGDNVQLLGLSVEQEAGNVNLETGGVTGMTVTIDASNKRLSLNTASTVFNETTANAVDVNVLGDGGTSILYVDASDDKVGINETSPATALHIDANTGIAITLEDAQVATPDAGAGTLGNLPAGVSGDPDGYLLLTINGVNVLLPFWNQ